MISFDDGDIEPVIDEWWDRWWCGWLWWVGGGNGGGSPDDASPRGNVDGGPCDPPTIDSIENCNGGDGCWTTWGGGGVEDDDLDGIGIWAEVVAGTITIELFPELDKPDGPGTPTPEFGKPFPPDPSNGTESSIDDDPRVDPSIFTLNKEIESFVYKIHSCCCFGSEYW